MPKVSFKLFIFICLIAIIFIPVFVVRIVSTITMESLSDKDDRTYDIDTWVEDNILDMDERKLKNPEWQEQLMTKAEEKGIELLIIYKEGNSLYTKGLIEPGHAIKIDEDRTKAGSLYEKYYFALDQYNIYSDNALIASVYISYPRPAEEQLKGMNYDFIMFIVVFSIVSILIIFFLHKNLIKPLYAIHQSSQLISSGTYTVNLPTSKIKEMSHSTQAFIEMVKKIELSKRNNERLEEERKLFVSSIVHDLRTPIFSLRGFLEGLLKGVVHKEQKKMQYLEMSMKQANHLNELVTSLANYANIEGQIQLKEIRLFQINDVISDLQQMLYFNLLEKNLTIQVNNLTIEPIAGDYVLMKRAFENVLVNSIRHSPVNEKIEVVMREKEGFIETIIVDNGKGFAEKELGYVFKPLYKGEPQKETSSQRMGLGLTITQVIIQKHSGSIEALNDIEKGAKIIVKIPKNYPN